MVKKSKKKPKTKAKKTPRAKPMSEGIVVIGKTGGFTTRKIEALNQTLKAVKELREAEANAEMEKKIGVALLTKAESIEDTKESFEALMVLMKEWSQRNREQAVSPKED